jgi:hypothetical protein
VQPHCPEVPYPPHVYGAGQLPASHTPPQPSEPQAFAGQLGVQSQFCWHEPPGPQAFATDVKPAGHQLWVAPGVLGVPLQ